MEGGNAAHADGRFPARSGGADVVLHETGFRHPVSRVLRGLSRFTAYRDLTHVAATARGVALGTTHGAWFIRRRHFEASDAPERLVEALRGRVAGLAAGPDRSRQMDRLDARVREAPRPHLGGVLAGVVVGIAAAVWVWSDLAAEFVFAARYVAEGELWRLVTLHGLHLHPLHLGLNAVALWVLGDLLELSLGRGRAALVAALSAAGAAAGCVWAGYVDALGASGVVSGFAGALLVLELRAPATVPAPWRLPRRLFVAAVVLDLGLSALVPGIAEAAHVGGFLAGGTAGWALLRPPGADLRAPGWVRFGNGLAAAVLVWAFATGTLAALDFERTWHARGERLLAAEAADPEALNEAAWRIAISEAPSRTLLALAEELALRAVTETRGLRPHILDTLAEVYFLEDRIEEALEVNADALRIDPEDPYLREQRRRYRGERARDDRPEPGEAPPDRIPIPDEPGIRI